MQDAAHQPCRSLFRLPRTQRTWPLQTPGDGKTAARCSRRALRHTASSIAPPHVLLFCASDTSASMTNSFSIHSVKPVCKWRMLQQAAPGQPRSICQVGALVRAAWYPVHYAGAQRHLSESEIIAAAASARSSCADSCTRRHAACVERAACVQVCVVCAHRCVEQPLAK